MICQEIDVKYKLKRVVNELEYTVAEEPCENCRRTRWVLTVLILSTMLAVVLLNQKAEAFFL